MRLIHFVFSRPRKVKYTLGLGHTDVNSNELAEHKVSADQIENCENCDLRNQND